MKICIETGDKDALLRPKVQVDETWVILLWVLVIIGMIPVIILTFVITKYITDSPLVFIILVFTDIVISAHLTWNDKQKHIKEHGGY